MFYVYALIDPINYVPFYIGKGTGNRMYNHLRLGEKFNKEKVNRIQIIRILGFEPLPMKIIDNIEDENEAYDMESFIIKECMIRKFPLTNSLGCKLRPKWTKEQIERRSKTVRETGCQRGKKISIETRKRLSEANKGKEGPNKVYIDANELKNQYLILNKTKAEVKKYFSIGTGSLNRVLKENQIRKIAQTSASINRQTWH